MSDHQWARVEDIFHQAVELAPESRAVFLDQACGGNESLRREVESLLDHESENGSTFAHPAADQPPQTIAHYRILSKLGQGGMGAVYRATDTKLGREVAIKVLPAFFAEDPDRLARFTREAKVLASLNHPNIAQIYGIEESNGVRALVMELVPGKTLGALVKPGPLPIETALNYAKQIADALEAAHEKGITHRDLKPANIMVTPEGVVKVLDFGLAAVSQVSTPADGNPSNSPTLTIRATQAGTIMGTAAYMSPEQASGKPVDKRADIWSFGVVLFEMLTGRRLFGGETISHTLADVLRGPIDFNALPPGTPAKIRELLKRCLERNVKNRLRDIGDGRIAIEEVLSGVPQDAVSVAVPPRRILLLGTVAVVALLIAGVLAFAYFTRKTPEAAAARFSFAPQFQATALDVAVSPDGKRIAFAHSNDRSSIWLRSVDSFAAEELPGTDQAVRPFWSPDGLSLGFFSSNRLRTMQVGNRQSPVQTLTSAYELSGGAWSPEGILYSPQATGMGLYRIPANGGASVPVTRLNAERNELSHRYPQFLPDGRHFIYWVWSTSDEYTGIYAGSLDPKEKLPKGPLVRTWREARYAEPGYLLFLQGSRFVAQRFDAAHMRPTGVPLSLPELVGISEGNTGRAMFSVSPGGVLVYQEAVQLPGARIVWRDRLGKQTRSIEAPQGSRSSWVSLAPDEKRVVVAGEDENALEDLWVVDLDRAASLRLTAIHGSNQYPVWSPDGRRIAFRSNRTGAYDLYAKLADGIGEGEELLVKSPNTKYAGSWSLDGRFMVYGEEDPKTGYDIWVLPLEGDRKPFPFLKTEFNESNGTLSPVLDSQGHQWMAYTSNETGRDEIYLRPFLPGSPAGPAGSKVRVSTGGGFHPQWRKDSRELFYVTADKMWAVDVKLGGTPEIGTPQVLFAHSWSNSSYAAFADGHRFLFLEPAGESPIPKINVVLNWTAELKQ